MKITSSLPALVFVVQPNQAADAWSPGMMPGRAGRAMVEVIGGPMCGGDGSTGGGVDCSSTFERMVRERAKIIDEMSTNNPFFERGSNYYRRGQSSSSSMNDEQSWNKNGSMNRPRRSRAQNSVQYEILSTEQEMKVALDVPGMKASDINVRLENNDKILIVTGSRESKGDGYRFASSFSEKFYVTSKIDVDKLSAELSDGVLIVSAPKIQEEIRKIPIVVSRSSGGAASENTNNGDDESSPVESIEVNKSKEKNKGDDDEDADDDVAALDTADTVDV